MNVVDLPTSEATRSLVARLQETSLAFGAAMARFGQAAAAFRSLGLSHWQAGELEPASEAFLAALSLDPENADLWRDLAAVFGALDRLTEADSAIRTSLVLHGRHSGSWLMLAGFHDRRDDPNAAEVAYRQAIEYDSMLAAAHFGLGLSLFKQKRFVEAAAAVSRAVTIDPENGFALTCLGHILFINSDFAGSARAFAAAEQNGPLDAESRRKQARAQTLRTMIDGHVREALLAYPDLAGADGEEIEIIARDAFSLLSASGHLEAATEIGRMRLAEKPDDPVRRYLLDAVSGCALTTAPLDYIETYFDQFAAQFDRQLVGTLRYVAPDVMVDRIGRHRTRFARMLDLGCGTGLAADRLAQFGPDLIGVDLSAKMLAEAGKRGRYAALIKAEAVAFLGRCGSGFDLVFAADLLVYLGDLAPFMDAAARATGTGSILAASLEVGPEAADYTLLPSGRFAHSAPYLKRLARPDFVLLDAIEHDIRLEAGVPVPGLYLVFERR